MSTAARWGNRNAIKTKEALNTCPDFLIRFHCGYCDTCGRPMITKRQYSVNPELATRWFVRAGNAKFCHACAARQRRIGSPGRPPAPRPRTVRPFDVMALRLQVGACLGCGWTRDAEESHMARACPLVARENEATSECA